MEDVTLMDRKKWLMESIDKKSGLYADISDRIWEYAETRFDVKKSADLYIGFLKNEGFEIDRGIAGMEHAFVATFGSGSPVIGILAEYDALANMSQAADIAEKCVLEAGANGHGCGHHALGAGSLAGAVGIKDMMIEYGLKGTVKLFGCPAEESGYGKAFMARNGDFEGVDAFLTWHPMDVTEVWGKSSLAVSQMHFDFRGVSSHAGAAPELGRSALDAAELMNIGVNFLREHIIDDARIHYAFTDAGGLSANVVQATASLHYLIRAPKQDQVKAIYDRVLKIAKGAAMMTETEVEVRWDSACANYIVNRSLAKAMHENMKSVFPLDFTGEEIRYEGHFFDTLSEEMRKSLLSKAKSMFPSGSRGFLDNVAGKALNDELGELVFSDKPMTGSTDVGDPSWIAPTAQLNVACMPHGTPPHSWQWVATGKSSVVHKGLIAAGKVIAMTALDILEDMKLLEDAKTEHMDNLGGEQYVCMIPEDVVPK